ncbi:ComEA family DNA-binding protein [Vibrio casei]|uniref:ComEA family DNA-binding protein n=1 Tax=Vibrio casei TaxID=673372 RepID=UPI0035B52946
MRTVFMTLLSMGLMFNIAYAEVKAEESSEVSTNKNTQEKHAGINITVNVNTANAEEIASMLKGIGAKKAQDIVDYRNEHGNFMSLEDLMNVKGIGQATVQKNQDRILL